MCECYGVKNESENTCATSVVRIVTFPAQRLLRREASFQKRRPKMLVSKILVWSCYHFWCIVIGHLIKGDPRSLDDSDTKDKYLASSFDFVKILLGHCHLDAIELMSIEALLCFST